METTITPQMLVLGSMIVLLLVGLVARRFEQRGHTHGSHPRFGADHGDAITEMCNRTRAEEAQRKERERRANAM